ncbi:hypothetical protein BG53_12485 [Paenibacillus darwinianus]|uniref:Uncharacterized protein n=1 Tax=Paenibacillus darwinianus TaxID=1380763 RepID=A0A9W5S3C4_9BACL|nr:hypothetical protein [Paenibacillus darwinianus]EXX90313.1 hypothetical protein BG52_13630 [Paenibacillus darwinianus]EXX90966.1 hypothetical protein BG53_12485 [Paenibacillus darwinianus]EXX90978.1 hypothetical protein CH50_14320 [Paenibacillus darwinianus]
MRIVTKDQYEARVEAVLEVVAEVTGNAPTSPSFKDKLYAMSFQELGAFVLNVVETRSVNGIDRY